MTNHRMAAGLSVVLLGAVAIAWIVTVERMRGMDAGPGTDLGKLGWYVGVWATMTAAMMLPSAVPQAARLAGRVPSASLFVVGYLAAWTAYGLAAYAVFRLVDLWGLDWLAWERAGPYVTGAVVAGAGLYELTPLKRSFLRRCRAPGHTPESGLRAGLEHGTDCIGCCFGLMLALFALGVMSILWMAIIAAVIFAEKVLPHGLGISRAVAVALLALGVCVAVSPTSVPGLTEPDGRQPMRMEMR